MAHDGRLARHAAQVDGDRLPPVCLRTACRIPLMPLHGTAVSNVSTPIPGAKGFRADRAVHTSPSP